VNNLGDDKQGETTMNKAEEKEWRRESKNLRPFTQQGHDSSTEHHLCNIEKDLSDRSGSHLFVEDEFMSQ